MFQTGLLCALVMLGADAQITFDDLFGVGTSLSGPQPDAFYLPPSDCVAPQNALTTNVKVQDEARTGGFSHHVDWYGYRNPNGPIRYLPPMDFELVQHSVGGTEADYLIPSDRGLVFTDHPNWNYIVSPGRAWDQEGDNGYSRASVPFALLQRNSQCVHNGVLMFLFKSDGSTSDVRYQITQESCMYFKADFWGQLQFEKSLAEKSSAAEASAIKANFDLELANRFPTKSLMNDLPRDFPGVDPSVFGSAVPDEHLNTYGIIVDGVQYTTRCRTRQGEYPHCFYMVQPSYSTAKSSFAGLAMMAAAQKYGSQVLFDLKVVDLLPREWEEYGTGNWSQVTLKNTLEMATGHYQSTTYMWDEDSSYMNRFFLRESYEEKVEQAFQFRERVDPGTRFCYHSSDTFLTVVGLQQFLELMNDPYPDAFDFLVENVLKPIGIQEGAYSSIRTIDEKQMAFGGYGMYWIQDDVAKLMQFVHINKGRAGGVQILEPESLAEAMQERPNERGLIPNNPSETLRYNYAFWADEYLAESNDNPFTCDMYIPYMSGYGGIRFVMMPNGVTYYYFSDDGQYTQRREVEESDKIRPLCG